MKENEKEKEKENEKEKEKEKEKVKEKEKEKEKEQARARPAACHWRLQRRRKGFAIFTCGLDRSRAQRRGRPVCAHDPRIRPRTTR